MASGWISLKRRPIQFPFSQMNFRLKIAYEKPSRSFFAFAKNFYKKGIDSLIIMHEGLDDIEYILFTAIVKKHSLKFFWQNLWFDQIKYETFSNPPLHFMSEKSFTLILLRLIQWHTRPDERHTQFYSLFNNMRGIPSGFQLFFPR